MGRKLTWFKKHADAYLVDVHVRALSYGARGLNEDLWCILRTQTDAPGWFIMEGQPMSTRCIEGVCKVYAPPDKGSRRYLSKYLLECLHSPLYAQIDGIWYSEYIVKEYEEIRVSTERGKRGGNPSLTTPVKGVVKPRIRIRKEEDKDARARAGESVEDSPRAALGDTIKRVWQKLGLNQEGLEDELDG